MSAEQPNPHGSPQTLKRTAALASYPYINALLDAIERRPLVRRATCEIDGCDAPFLGAARNMVQQCAAGHRRSAG